jgi:DNA excision repair protein ERCC-2
MAEHTVAVRELAAFCHRQGDIDYRYTPSPTPEEGIRGHQEVYRRRADSYQAEYALEASFDFAHFGLRIRGRADGYDPVAGVIEEIKTCRVDPVSIPATVEHLHWAQAMLYGALLMLQEPERRQLELHLTWFNINTGQELTLRKTLEREEISAFLDESVVCYSDWIGQWLEWQHLRDDSIAELDFPHPDFRPGQRDAAESVYKCITQRGQLLLQAPTGIGKTAAVIFPALKALVADKHDVVSFVTARTVGRLAAENTLAIMAQSGLRLRRLSLSAKDSICFSPGKACHGEDCPYARGYYDRLPAARNAAMTRDDLGRRGLEELAREYSICPYQLSIDLIPWVDFSIADIHYIYSFNATVSTAYRQAGLRWTVLLDEAHNLPDRARDMFSAELFKADLMRARRQSGGEIKRALDRCNRVLLELLKQEWQEPNYHCQPTVPENLLVALQRLEGAISSQRAQDPLLLQRQPELLEFYFAILQFQRVIDVMQEDYRFELSRSESSQSLRLRLNCLDGSRLLCQRQAELHSITAFSATLTPPHWMLRGLGLGGEAVFQDLASPFDRKQYPVSLRTDIDTRFRARQGSLRKLSAAIGNWLATTPGNCIVYFSSYQYMAEVLDLLSSSLGDRHLMVQLREQGETARTEFLETLGARQDVVAFCILGGVFGEGIDLPGDALRSVVIVGVGLPQFNRERQSLRDYHQLKSGRGFEFAYLYPAMQKVNQALGRVIRSETDTGQALLIDTRFADPSYRGLLPQGWDYQFLGVDSESLGS